MIRKGTAGNPPVPRIELTVPIASGNDTVPGKSKDPAGLVGLAGLERLDLLTMAIRFDFKGPVRPASRDELDLVMFEAKADEQVFNIPGSQVWVLDDLSSFASRRKREKVR